MIKLYLDVLFITNLAVCIVLISAAAQFSHTAIRPRRLFLAAAVGACASFTVMLGSKPLILIIKLAAAVAASAVAFGALDPRALIKRSFSLVFAYLTFIAAVYLIWFFTGSGRIYIMFATVYFDVSVLTLIFSCIACYTIMSVAERIYTSFAYKNSAYKIEVAFNGGSYKLEALADTGNAVRDHITGKPVVVCISDKICSDLKLRDGLPKGFRLLPYSTVSSPVSLMWLTRPQTLKITDGKGNTKPVDAAVGIVEGSDEQAVFNPMLLV